MQKGSKTVQKIFIKQILSWLTKRGAKKNVMGMDDKERCEVKMVPVQKERGAFYPPSSNRSSLAWGINKRCPIIA